MKEIERKFLVANDAWRERADEGQLILQGYVAIANGNSARVRILGNGSATLTVKIGGSGLVREEFEYPIPVGDARRMLTRCQGNMIDKTRHLLAHGGFVWEIDVYNGELEGLVVAEVEMESETDEPPLPDWLGRELTGDSAWSNAALAIRGRPEA